MSDGNPTTSFHRASRTVAGLGCVLDPWASRRAWPCPEAPEFGLEDMDCGEGALNRFKELPTRVRGAQDRVPFMDLSAVRADPALGAASAACGVGPVVDLLSAFDRAGVLCSALCGAIPYGYDPPDCPGLDDDMGMNMSACFEDQETMDPGFMMPRRPDPWGAAVGVLPDPAAPSCPGKSSSGSTMCEERCAGVVNGVMYVGGCWFGQLDTVCACGSAIYVKASLPLVIGCNCCGHQPPVPEESSSSSSASSQSSASELHAPCGGELELNGFSYGPCEIGSLYPLGLEGEETHTNMNDVLIDAYGACEAAHANYCSQENGGRYANCAPWVTGWDLQGCVISVPWAAGDGLWHVKWWRCCVNPA